MENLTWLISRSTKVFEVISVEKIQYQAVFIINSPNESCTVHLSLLECSFLSLNSCVGIWTILSKRVIFDIWTNWWPCILEFQLLGQLNFFDYEFLAGCSTGSIFQEVCSLINIGISEKNCQNADATVKQIRELNATSTIFSFS